MHFKEVKFYTSIWLWNENFYFEEKKEIVFVWRSNVWKSSLMNSLFEKKDLVKTSSRPWKTQLANIFLVWNKYYFTDLPWYWFAKLGKSKKEELDWLISWYLEEKVEYIKNVIILIDAKLWPQEIDIYMYKYILDLWLNVTIVLSKIDKLWKLEIWKSKELTKKIFFGQNIISISSSKKIWIQDLSKIIKKSLLL